MWSVSPFRTCLNFFKFPNIWEILRFFWLHNNGSYFRLLVVMCWFLWWGRNRWKFERVSWSAEVTAGKAAIFLTSFEEVHEPSDSVDINSDAKWGKPVESWFRINFDAVVPCDDNVWGLTIVARSSNGEWLLGSAKQFFSRISDEVSEAIALLRFVSDAITRGWNFVEFEGDCLNVINLVKQGVVNLFKLDLNITADKHA